MATDDKPKCGLCGEPMPEGEEMFKYHGYSGDCPKPPLPKRAEPETGWVLVKEPDEYGLSYIGVIDGLLQWTHDNLKALRLARREDADALAELVDDCWRVEEHAWG